MMLVMMVKMQSVFVIDVSEHEITSVVLKFRNKAASGSRCE